MAILAPIVQYYKYIYPIHVFHAAYCMCMDSLIKEKNNNNTVMGKKNVKIGLFVLLVFIIKYLMSLKRHSIIKTQPIESRTVKIRNSQNVL